MNRSLSALWSTRWIAVLGVSLLVAAQPVYANITGFTVTEIKGTCKVKGSDGQYVPAVLNQTYPFGTTVKTGRNSYMSMAFSPGNTFRLLARTTLRISEDVRNPKLKVLKLEKGNISLKLDAFPKDHKLQVETPTAICGAVGTRFVVSFDEDVADEQITATGKSRFSCSEGEVTLASRFSVGGKAVTGRTFDVPSMQAGGELVAVIHEGLENSYSDITVNRGRMAFTYGGDDKNTLNVSSSDGKPTRFVCSLEKSESDVNLVALKIENGNVSQKRKRFMRGDSEEPIAATGSTVMLQGGKVYADKDDIIGSYIVAAKNEGELHSQVRAMKRSGQPAEAVASVEAELAKAAQEATRLRQRLLSKRTRKMLRTIRGANRRRIR